LLGQFKAAHYSDADRAHADLATMLQQLVLLATDMNDGDKQPTDKDVFGSSSRD